jgi:pectate lyase
MLTRRELFKATSAWAGGLAVMSAAGAVSSVFTAGPASAAIPAFPGAEGFGAASLGGRGGRTIEVTNLNDSGPGSLRAAVAAVGARTIVFRVGGTIALNAPITVSNPYLTIAGQTAPGGGVCLRNGSNKRPCLIVTTHDVIIRFVRMRPGVGGATFPNDTVRGLTITNSGTAVPYNVVVDHCSMSWGIDTDATVGGTAHDITVQWCIVSEGLKNSVHLEGPHSRGLAIRDRTRNVTAHHNLLAHNTYRNPEISNLGPTQVVNNVIYDHETRAISSSDVNGVLVPFAAVSNLIKAGPSTGDRHEIELHPMTGAGWAVYASHNIGPYRTSDTMAESASLTPVDAKYLVTTPPFAMPFVSTSSAADAYSAVLAKAGATFPSRDAVDARVVGEVATGTGRIIDDPSQVGGWPVLGTGAAPIDSDHDGIPDDWELAHGLNPTDPGDAAHLAPNGHTWLENYLNELVTGL